MELKMVFPNSDPVDTRESCTPDIEYISTVYMMKQTS